MHRSRIRPSLSLAGVLALTSCSTSSSPDVGEFVTVQFRRDALGAAHTLPIDPTTHVFNGASTNLQGELVSLDADWVVVREGDNTHWIARPTVLLLSQR
ncbi:MAG: hypothetical protein P8R43_06785 [Planctomycetota bacterium]|nr:hypothetical protein [Planctomycetota bacterium]